MRLKRAPLSTVIKPLHGEIYILQARGDRISLIYARNCIEFEIFHAMALRAYFAIVGKGDLPLFESSLGSAALSSSASPTTTAGAQQASKVQVCSVICSG